MLEGYPTLSGITEQFDRFLQLNHPEFFGEKAVHPVLSLKSYKVIHDHLWGTNRFSWRERALIDSPIFQKGGGIRPTGRAFYVYPHLRASTVETSLGVATHAAY